MKRIFDLFLIIVTSPFSLFVIAVFAILIKLNIGTPIFFIQERSGLNGKPFNIIKFRSMSDKKDTNGELLQDKDRLSSFGSLIRSLSIDELPGLWNVLKGEMSIVGPRPLLMRYLSRYSNHQLKRLKVKPGITGLAQVKGRNSLSWEEKFEYDIFYAENQTLLLDIKLIIATFGKVIYKEGINTSQSETMSEFYGEGNMIYNNKDKELK